MYWFKVFFTLEIFLSTLLTFHCVLLRSHFRIDGILSKNLLYETRDRGKFSSRQFSMNCKQTHNVVLNPLSSISNSSLRIDLRRRFIDLRKLYPSRNEVWMRGKFRKFQTLHWKSKLNTIVNLGWISNAKWSFSVK